MTTVEPSEVLILIALGMVLGVLGQLARLVGELADPTSEVNGRALAITIGTAVVVGATAGGLGAVSFLGKEISVQDVVALIGIGYVGADFVEQFLKRKFESLRATSRS